MPDICRCATCNRETYLDLANCPHCGAMLVQMAEAPPETYQPTPSFEELQAGLANGTLAIKVVREGVSSHDIYDLIPKIYAREMIIRFFAIPALAIGGLIGFFMLESMLDFEIGNQRPDSQLVGLFLFGPPILFSFLLLLRRDARIAKRIKTDRDCYAAAMQHGLVQVLPVVEDGGRDKFQPW